MLKGSRFYFLGQWSLENRGCEALIRSTAKLIREHDRKASFLCPSENAVLDRAQWPNSEDDGVYFCSDIEFSRQLKIISQITKRVPLLKKLDRLPLRLDPKTKYLISGIDAVLMTGGDIISLDYGELPLLFWTGVVEAAIRLGKPAHLVGGIRWPVFYQPKDRTTHD